MKPSPPTDLLVPEQGTFSQNSLLADGAPRQVLRKGFSGIHIRSIGAEDGVPRIIEASRLGGALIY